MENITTYNYEAFYLDYLEGNLGDIETAMLFDFLNQHPDIKAELELDADVLELTLEKSTETLHKFDKEDLKYFDCKANEICLNNVNDFIIADLEGEITADKKVALHQFIAEHNLKASKDYFFATKLQADLSEVYPNKTELKKKGTIIPLWAKIASAAAVVLLLVNFFGDTNDVTESYSPRQGSFALQIDKTVTPFELNSVNSDNSSATNQTHSIAVHHEGINDNTNTEKDSVITPLLNVFPNHDIVKEKVEDNKVENNKENDHLITPLEEDKPIDDVAVIEHNQQSETPTNDIKLVDMYKPVTDLTNNYTSLNVSYKKSVPESDYQVTTFSIGKFSFERKKRK